MRQIGVVLTTEEEVAYVAVQRMSACEGCHKANPGTETEGVPACHECMMFPMETTMQVKAENPIGAREGDRVVLESETATVLGYAAAVFLAPILMAFLLGVLLALLWRHPAAPYVGAVFGFVGTFLLLRLVLDRYAGAREAEKTSYTVTDILKRRDV